MRDEEFVIEGRNAVLEAFRSGKTIDKLFVQDGRLKGYILLGDVERAGIYTALIREQTPLSQVDFDLMFEKPQLMAFSRSERVRRMGGLPQ